jgi:hypothetical protein
MDVSNREGVSQVLEIVMGQNSELVKRDNIPKTKRKIKIG